MDSLTDVTALVGGIAGLISLAILIYKTVMERPKLKFNFETAYFLSPVDKNNPSTVFAISLKVNNKGQRNTTIYSVTFSFEYNGKTYQPRTNFAGSTIQVAPDNTVPLHLTLYFLPEDGKFEKSVKMVS